MINIKISQVVGWVLSLPAAIVGYLIPVLIVRLFFENPFSEHHYVLLVLHVISNSLGCTFFMQFGVRTWGEKYRIQICVFYAMLLCCFYGTCIAGINNDLYPTWYKADVILSFLTSLFCVFSACMFFVVEVIKEMYEELNPIEMDEELDKLKI
jgi:hypothetical protein